MADAGGQTTQAGIGYQDKIAALYLGRMIDPRAIRLPADQQVIEVRGEKPGVAVDDVVVCFADGHTIYIQAKTALVDRGKPWEKLWEHFYCQRHAVDFHSPQDRLVLWIGNPEDWYKTLKTICKQAASSQNTAEWLKRLSLEKIQAKEKIRLLLNKRLGAEAYPSAPGGSQTQGTEGKESLQDEAMHSLMGCIDLRFTEDDTLEEEHLVSWMPDCNVNHAALFSHLVKLVLEGAKEGRAMRQADLLQALIRLDVQVKPLEQQRAFPVAKRCDYYDYIALPPNLVPRPELLAEVRQTLLDNPDGVALTSALQMRALHGMGGIGKSVMARLLCEDVEIQAEYPDGILWTTLGMTPDIRQKLKEWMDALGVRPEVLNPSPEQYKNELAKALKKRQVLLVVDDVWDGAHLDYFLVGGPGCQHLITTRIAKLAETAGAQLCPVPAMTQAEAVALLEQWAKGSLDNTPYDEKLKVVARLRRLPLAVKLAGAKLQKMPLQKWLAQFDKLRRLEAEPDSADPEKSLEASFQLSLDGLKVKHRELYLTLGIFPEDEGIPDAPVIRLWQALDPSLDAGDCQALLEYFAGQALLDRSGEQTGLHDLMRQFMQEKLGEAGLREMHQRLLQAYAETQSGEGWHTLSDDGYIYQHLAWHMRQAEQNAELYRLINKEWKDAKFALYLNHQSFSQDVDIAIQAADKEKDLPELVRLCLLYATLGVLATNAPAEALGVLARCGRAEAALGYAALVQEAGKRCEAYRLIGEALLVVGEAQKGSAALKQALAAAEKIGDDESKARALSGVAEALAQAGDLEGLRRALAAAEKIGDEWFKAETLSGVAGALVQAGDLGGARDAARQALAAAEKIGDDDYTAEALSGVARVLAQAGDLEGARGAARQALAAAEKIGYDDSKAEALSGVVGALAQAGDLEGLREALAAAEKIKDEWHKAEALSGVAGALAQAGDLEGAQGAARQALAAAEKIMNEYSKAEALSGVAAALAQAGDLEGARDAARQALAAAEKIKNEWQKAQALSGVAGALAQAGDLEGARGAARQALAAAEKIGDESSKVEALSGVAGALAQAGDREGLRGALAAAEKIGDESSKAKALSGVAGALAQAGDLEGLRGALVAVEKIGYEIYKARALSGVAGALAQAGDLEGLREALATAEKIVSEWDKARALSGVAGALAQAGDLEGARGAARQALAAAEKIGYDDSKAEALSGVAGALAQAGDLEGARGAARQTLAAAEKIGYDDYKAEALSGVAVALAQAGDLGGARDAARQALAAAKKIMNEYSKAEALSGVAAALAQAGDREGARGAARQALAAAEKIEDERYKAQALSGVARVLAQAGDLERLRGALVVAEWIRDERYKAEALSGVAGVLAQAGDLEGLRWARVAAEKIKDERHKAEALSGVARALAQAGDLGGLRGALAAAEKIGDERSKAEALSGVAGVLAQAGDLEGLRWALAAAEKIMNEWSKARALSGVARALAQAGDLGGLRGALATAEKIVSEWGKAEALSGVAGALAQAGDREGARGAARQALVVAEKIGVNEYKVQALSGVAGALARAGDRKGLEVFRLAMLTARLVSRKSVFYALNRCTPLLADLDGGKTLWQITETIVEVDHWWRKFTVLFQEAA